MSTKVIGFPSNPAVDDEYQGWVWDGDKWVSDAVKGGLWEQNGDNIYYNDGNVGIGQSAPDAKLTVTTGDDGEQATFGSLSNDRGLSVSTFTNNATGAGVDLNARGFTGVNGLLSLSTNSQPRLTINAAGNVGIGMDPATFDLSAKEQLAEWKTKAKKASWEIVTKGAFEQEPTEDLVAEWMETRAAGDKLQVAGNATFSDYITAKALNLTAGGKYLAFNANVSSSNTSALIQADTGMELHLAANKQGGQVKIHTSGNATFFGTVDAAGFTINGVPISGGGGDFEAISGDTNGTGWGWRHPTAPNKEGVFITNNGEFFCPSKANHISLGTTQQKWKDLSLSGEAKATDFIASSDERLKTRIAPMPVGLIDDIKPVSWDWIDGGGKSAGVVAQQLQEIGLGDYVRESEDGELGVNYQALTAILLAEVIALKKAIK